MRSLHKTLALLGTALVAAGPAHSADEQYPSKPVRVVVVFPPAGGTDIVARMIFTKLAERMKTNFVIDNRGGAGGVIGTEIVAKSIPDGYTLGVVSGSHAINPALYSKLPYDSVADFTPVTMLVSGPGLLVVNPSLPATSVKELIALARAKPRGLSYASAGNGTPPHLFAELFKTMAHVDIVHVPYKGNGPAMIDLISGQVQLSLPTIPSALPYVKTGKLRALGVTSKKRSSILPDVPSIAEAGLPGYDATSWYGVLGPAKLPAGIANVLQQNLAAVLEHSDLKDKLLAQGLEPVANKPKTFGEEIRAELVKWKKVVAASGAKIE
jgi:tripartite-type tricarboxylate transporter receptor subunit TctC